MIKKTTTKPTDHLSVAFKKVRDATFNNPHITRSDAIAVLRMIEHELTGKLMFEWREAITNV